MSEYDFYQIFQHAYYSIAALGMASLMVLVIWECISVSIPDPFDGILTLAFGFGFVFVCLTAPFLIIWTIRCHQVPNVCI